MESGKSFLLHVDFIGSETGTEYMKTIADHYADQMDGTVFLSPEDVHAVARWEEMGIPLKAAIVGIDAASDRWSKRGEGPRSIRWCESFILRAWRKTSKSRVTNISFGEKFNTNLERLSAEIERRRESSPELPVEVDNALREALDRLKEIPEDADDELRAVAINEAEDKLRDALVCCAGDKLSREARKEAESQLAKHKHRMEKAIHEKTLEAVTGKIIREKLDLADISFYDLLRHEYDAV